MLIHRVFEKIKLDIAFANAAINIFPEGGPRDDVGTLNVCAHPTWGILANFEHKCWSPVSGSLNTVKTRETDQSLECGELGYGCSAILKVPRIPSSSNFPGKEVKIIFLDSLQL